MSLLFAFRFIYTLIREKYPRYRVQFEGTRYLLLLFIVIYCGLVSQELELFITAGTTISPSSPIGTDDGSNDINNYVILSMGLSQVGRCVNANTHNYFVQMKDLYSSGTISNGSSINNQSFDILNYQTALSRSLNYDGVEPHKMASPVCYYDNDISCIDDAHFATCRGIFASPKYQYSIADFTTLFNFDEQQLSHPYFPYIQLIVNLAILGIFFIAAHGVTQLHIHKFFLSFCNEINGFILLALMIQSIYNVQLIFEENCLALLNTSTPEHERTQFCSALQSCGLTVSSVLDLNGNIAQYYFRILGFFSVVWLIFISVHVVCFIIHHIHLQEIYVIEALQQSILEQSGNDLITTLDTAPKPFVDLYLSHWEYVPLSTLQLMQYPLPGTIVENSSNNNSNSNNTLGLSPTNNPLHTSTATTDLNECNTAECSICLGNLIESTASAAAAATASATASSDTSHRNSMLHVQRLMRRLSSNINRVSRQISQRLSSLWTRSREGTSSNNSSSIGGAHTRLATYADSATDSEIAAATNNNMNSPTPVTGAYVELESPTIVSDNESKSKLKQRSSYLPLSSQSSSNPSTQHFDHDTTDDYNYNSADDDNDHNVEPQMQNVIKLHCNHLFHQACILQWASTANNTQCPVCRQPLHQDPDYNSFSMALLR